MICVNSTNTAALVIMNSLFSSPVQWQRGDSDRGPRVNRGGVSRRGRGLEHQLSHHAVSLQSGDEAERLALHAKINVSAQFRVIEQPLAVAGMFHGPQQIGLQERIDSPRDLSRIGDLPRGVVGPE